MREQIESRVNTRMLVANEEEEPSSAEATAASSEQMQSEVAARVDARIQAASIATAPNTDKAHVEPDAQEQAPQ